MDIVERIEPYLEQRPDYVICHSLSGFPARTVVTPDGRRHLLNVLSAGSFVQGVITVLFHPFSLSGLILDLDAIRPYRRVPSTGHLMIDRITHSGARFVLNTFGSVVPAEALIRNAICRGCRIMIAEPTTPGHASRRMAFPWESKESENSACVLPRS